MITPSFGLTATERVLPRLALDFTTASLDPRVTFTRSGATATRVNASGYIETMAADTPRFDFNPVTLVCRGLLIEESRTNNTLGSAAFNDAAYWTPVASTIGATPITAPDNTSTGFKLIESTANAVHYVLPVLGWVTTVGQLITRSVYVKAGERFRFEIHTDSTSYGGAQRAQYNLSTVTATVVLGTGTASITNAGNGWYRCVFNAPPATAAAIGSGQFRLLDDAGNPAYTGNGSSGLYLWGAQREDGAFATSYIPTVASTVTRNADVATMTGTNFSSWYNQSEGTVYSEIISTSNSDQWSITDGTTNNGITPYTNGNIVSYIRALGATQVQQDVGAAPSSSSNKAAFAYKVNNFAASVNGGAVVTDTSGIVPVNPNQLVLGYTSVVWAAAKTQLYIQSFNYYSLRLTNNELQAITS